MSDYRKDQSKFLDDLEERARHGQILERLAAKVAEARLWKVKGSAIYETFTHAERHYPQWVGYTFMDSLDEFNCRTLTNAYR